MNPTTRQALGWMAVFLSAFCFYISTVIIRWSQSEAVIAPSYFVFVRFILGFLVVCIIMAWQKRLPAPRSYHLLVGRTIANCVAVYCFYMAVNHTTIAEANILNMTYPVFVAILSWVFLHQQRDLAALCMVAVAFAGIWLILTPGRIDLKTENLWGLASGISASFAILYLNVSRQYHDTNTVLFFMFGLGTVIMFALFRSSFFWPDQTAFFYLMMCAISGVTGQFLLTIGFRYVTAVEGSIISSMRIFLAAFLGPFVASEPALTKAGWIGALLLFCANAALAYRRN
jgi:drug/metabolite transporter (DMT)-like permease